MTDVAHVRDGDHKGAFVIERGGARLGEMTYTMAGELVIIDHTDVSEALRGQGAGRKMLDALVAWARSEGRKILPLCPYAKSQFDKDPSLRDVLSA